MIRQMNVEQIQQSIQQIVQGRPEIQLVCLFGSRARNQAHWQSDYDIAVLLEPMPENAPRYKLDLLNELIRVLRRDAVDLVIINQASPLLKMTIYRDGQILYAASPAVWPQFAVQTLHEYEDTKKLRAILNHYFIKRLKASQEMP